MVETKILRNEIIKLINEQLENKRFQLDSETENKICSIVNIAFHEGYADCLKDVREGLIK